MWRGYQINELIWGGGGLYCAALASFKGVRAMSDQEASVGFWSSRNFGWVTNHFCLELDSQKSNFEKLISLSRWVKHENIGRTCTILGLGKTMEYGNQILKNFYFAFFFLNPRCLLIDLVHWVKRELKTFFKKSSLVLIHLTPFAWRSGQTSSMLGGAQFNATLLPVKHCQRFTMRTWQFSSQS